MCHAWDDGYSRTGANECEECPDFATNLSILLISLILIISVIAIMVISQLNRKKIALHSIYFKIFVNYLQIIMIMVSFKLNWPDIVQDFLFYQESAGSVTGRIFTIECLMEEILSLDTYFSQLILFAILPLIILIICSMFWALKSLIN